MVTVSRISSNEQGLGRKASAPRLEAAILNHLGQYSDPNKVRELLDASGKREGRRAERERLKGQQAEVTGWLSGQHERQETVGSLPTRVHSPLEDVQSLNSKLGTCRSSSMPTEGRRSLAIA